jgi:hypothetical protein
MSIGVVPASGVVTGAAGALATVGAAGAAAVCTGWSFVGTGAAAATSDAGTPPPGCPAAPASRSVNNVATPLLWAPAASATAERSAKTAERLF